MKMLYVGTFYERNIQITVKGFAKFNKEYCNLLNMCYDLIGFGSQEEIDLIKETIQESGLIDNIIFHGSVRYPELEEYFKASNIGISFIPMTKYYDCQPPTKTYEYLLSGMAVLATGTSENQMVITSENGCIIKDTPEDFYNGLKNIYSNLEHYNSQQIQQTAEIFSWDKIISDNFIPYIETVFYK